MGWVAFVCEAVLVQVAVHGALMGRVRQHMVINGDPRHSSACNYSFLRIPPPSNYVNSHGHPWGAPTPQSLSQGHPLLQACLNAALAQWLMTQAAYCVRAVEADIRFPFPGSL